MNGPRFGSVADIPESPKPLAPLRKRTSFFSVSLIVYGALVPLLAETGPKAGTNASSVVTRDPRSLSMSMSLLTCATSTVKPLTNALVGPAVLMTTAIAFAAGAVAKMSVIEFAFVKTV